MSLAKFRIEYIDLEVDVIHDLNINDYMDGRADSISFSFHYDKDLTTLIPLRTKASLELLGGTTTKGKTYNMMITDMSSQLNTMYGDVNGFTITIMMKEHTIALRDNIRTDVKITPALIHGDNFKYLDGALKKVIGVHNMIPFNEKIKEIDDPLLDALSRVTCPTLMYKDMSTFNQLSDILLRVGRVPYLENGKLYGILLQGDRNKTDKNIEEYMTSYVVTKTDDNNSGAVSSKVNNIIYDKELVTVPALFDSYINNNQLIGIEWDSEFTGTIDFTGTPTKTNNETSIYLEGGPIGEFLKNLMVEFDSSGPLRLLTIDGYNPEAKDVISPLDFSIELPTEIEYIDKIYKVVPRIEVTSGKIGGGSGTGGVREVNSKIVFDLVELDMDRILEHDAWSQLSANQKKMKSYYVRGEKQIRQIASIIVPESDFSSDSDLIDSWKTSRGNLYRTLRETLIAVRYKPIRSVTYTSYDYSKADNDKYLNKPTSISTIDLPYKQVSDKQITPALSYELQKKLDKNRNINFITNDWSVLELQASDIILLYGEKHIISTVQFLINEDSIEVNMILNDKIIINNSFSNYEDDIRISTNLSKEGVSRRDLPIFIEQLISLSDVSDTYLYENDDILTEEVISERLLEVIRDIKFNNLNKLSDKLNSNLQLSFTGDDGVPTGTTITQVYNSVSGNISHLGYDIVNKNYSNQRIHLEDKVFEENSTEIIPGGGNFFYMFRQYAFGEPTIVQLPIKLNNVDPALYNLSDSNVYLSHIGEYRFYFNRLGYDNTINHALLVDKSEIINPYIQVITLDSNILNEGEIEKKVFIKELNKDIEWYSVNGINPLDGDLKVGFVPRHTPLSGIDWRPPIIENIINKVTTDENKYIDLHLEDFINYDDGFEYVLINNTTEEILFKFDILKGEEEVVKVDKIRINYKYTHSYENYE